MSEMNAINLNEQKRCPFMPPIIGQRPLDGKPVVMAIPCLGDMCNFHKDNTGCLIAAFLERATI